MPLPHALEEAFVLSSPDQVRIRYFESADAFLDISEIVTSIDWEESKENVARRFTLQLDAYPGLDVLRIRNGGVLVLDYGPVAGRWEEWFRGPVVTGAGEHSPSEAFRSITAEDPMRSFGKSDGRFSFPPGSTATQLIRSMLRRLRVPAGELEDTKVKLPGGMTYQGSFYDAIIVLLHKTMRLGGDRFIPEFHKGRFWLVKHTAPAWTWRIDDAVERLRSESSIAEIPTRLVLMNGRQLVPKNVGPAAGDAPLSKDGPVYDVVADGDEWAVRQGDEDVSSHSRQELAVAAAKRLVAKNGAGDVRLHQKNGKARSVYAARRERKDQRPSTRVEQVVVTAPPRLRRQLGIVQAIQDADPGTGGTPRALRASANTRLRQAMRPQESLEVQVPFQALTLRRLQPITFEEMDEVTGARGRYFVSSLSGHLGADGGSVRLELERTPDFPDPQTGSLEFVNPPAGGAAGAAALRGDELTVGASYFGGPNDHTVGKHTASGKVLDNALLGFAELSTNYGAGASGCDFAALGKLAMGTVLEVTYGGKRIEIPKVDVGCGGPPVEGYPRAVDLTYAAARELGFTGLGTLRVRRADGRPLIIRGS